MPIKKTWKRMAPVLILVLICVVVSGLIALANEITAPIIAKAEAEKLQRTLNELLPQATGFIEIPCDMENVVSIYKDEGGSGFVFVTVGRGYHGDLTVMTALDSEGQVLALSANVSGETPGVGTRAGQAGYTSRFVGLSNSADGVDAISGATYSSRGIKSAVNTALAAFVVIKGA